MALDKTRLETELNNALLGEEVLSKELQPAPIKVNAKEVINEEALEAFNNQVKNIATAIENYIKSGEVKTIVNTSVAGATPLPITPPPPIVGSGTGEGVIV